MRTRMVDQHQLCMLNVPFFAVHADARSTLPLIETLKFPRIAPNTIHSAPLSGGKRSCSLIPPVSARKCANRASRRNTARTAVFRPVGRARRDGSGERGAGTQGASGTLGGRLRTRSARRPSPMAGRFYAQVGADRASLGDSARAAHGGRAPPDSRHAPRPASSLGGIRRTTLNQPH